jgi:hypothetical protein
MGLCCMAFCLVGQAVGASAQTTPPDQIVYTTGNSSEPLSSTSHLLFNSVNASLLPSGEGTDTPSFFVQKLAGEHGIFIVDNNPSDTSYTYPFNIETYNVTSIVGGIAAGIRVHVDPSNTIPPTTSVFANLAGIGIGNHGAYTAGLEILTQGATGSGPGVENTQGTSILSQSWGQSGLYSTEGDPTDITGTIGAFFNHYSTGHVIQMQQSSSAMTGDFINANAQAGSGTFTGNFLNFLINSAPVFQVNNQGDVATLGTVVLPNLKANSGTRFVCINTSGQLISQVKPCSGT